MNFDGTISDEEILSEVLYLISDINEALSRTSILSESVFTRSYLRLAFIEIDSILASVPQERDVGLRRAERLAKFTGLPDFAFVLLTSTNALCAANEEWELQLVESFGPKRAAIMRKSAAGQGAPASALRKAYCRFERALRDWESAARGTE